VFIMKIYHSLLLSTVYLRESHRTKYVLMRARILPGSTLRSLTRSEVLLESSAKDIDIEFRCCCACCCAGVAAATFVHSLLRSSRASEVLWFYESTSRPQTLQHPETMTPSLQKLRTAASSLHLSEVFLKVYARNFSSYHTSQRASWRYTRLHKSTLVL
jgi:hypothetical protein